MNRQNLISKVSLGFWGLFVLFVWHLSDDPRMADGGLSFQEGSFVEITFIFVLVSLTFANMAIGISRAYHAKKQGWLFAVILFWPVSYVYTLLINRGSANPSFKRD